MRRYVYTCISETAVKKWWHFIQQNTKQLRVERIRCNNAFKFEPQISCLCKIAAQKLRAINGISSLSDAEKKQLTFDGIMKFFFSYCSAKRTFNYRKSNDLIIEFTKVLYKECMMTEGACFKGFCNLVEVFVFTLKDVFRK